MRVTPLFGTLELPRMMVGALLAPVVAPRFAAWFAVVVILGFEALVVLEVAALPLLAELVLVTPGSAEIVDPGLTKFAVLAPVVELTPPIRSVVAFAEGAVLEPDVL
jgi:hypothetical protein